MLKYIPMKTQQHTCMHTTYKAGIRRPPFALIRSSFLLPERSGLVVECLTRDRRAAGSSLTGVTAFWSLSKTHLS